MSEFEALLKGSADHSKIDNIRIAILELGRLYVRPKPKGREGALYLELYLATKDMAGKSRKKHAALCGVSLPGLRKFEEKNGIQKT